MASFVGSCGRGNAGSRFNKVLSSHGNAVFTWWLKRGTERKMGSHEVFLSLVHGITEELRLEKMSRDSLV